MYFRPPSIVLHVEPGRIYYLGRITVAPAERPHRQFDRRKGFPLPGDYSASLLYSEELLTKACDENPEAFDSRPLSFPFFRPEPAESLIDCGNRQ